MKKLLSIMLALLLLVTCFAGCSSENSAVPGSDNKTVEEENTEIGKLVMGTNAAFPPYEFVDDNGKIVGIDAEIAEAVAKKLGLELEIKDMDFDSLLTAVQSKSVDIVLAGMTVTDERKLAVNFSDTYATGVQVIIVNENSAIKTVDDLKNKKIGVQAGTTGDIYCTDEFGQENVKQYQNGALAVAALNNKQVDCVVIDNEPAKKFVEANKGLKILETEYAVEDYAAAINKDNTDLLEKFNKALSELKADGTIAGIIEKYIPTK